MLSQILFTLYYSAENLHGTPAILLHLYHLSPLERVGNGDMHLNEDSDVAHDQKMPIWSHFWPRC